MGSDAPPPGMAIGVLISGSGSNLQALLEACERGLIPGRVVLVISNVDGVFGLERARQRGIPTRVVDHRAFGGSPAGREAFDRSIAELLDEARVALVCLAGFMRILSPWLVTHYRHRLLNIHPALLPAFPGLHVQQRAIEAGVRFSGATVHFVEAEVDAGPIVIQAVVPILPSDTAETLGRRILQQEHRIYPMAVRWFAQGRIVIEEGRVRIEGGGYDPDGVLLAPLWEDGW